MLGAIQMKTTSLTLLFLFSIISPCKANLDSTKLALFGKEKLPLELIKKADSLLVEAVEYYNSKTARGYNFISLSDSLYSEYLYLDSLTKIVSPYLKKNGKSKKHLIKKLPLADKENIESIISQKMAIDKRIGQLKELGKPNGKDSLVMSWGDAGHIDIQTYYRQYQYWFDNEGNCTIRVACFCPNAIEMLDQMPTEHQIDWRVTQLKLSDGGSCFFTLLLDLNNNRASFMQVNGI